MVPSQSAGGLKAWLHRHSHLFVAVKGLLEQSGFQPLRTKLGLGEPWKVRTLREELYYRLDRHWKTAGHRLAAEELARFMAPLLDSRDESER